ncbi:MAG: hypothetical protein KIT84_07750 [Labilithrix sp.]|nr:hypothetical protein [Labilithrix sp.]MCW5810890.1 hypothetical protein [Labilithrix sp.]
MRAVCAIFVVVAACGGPSDSPPPGSGKLVVGMQSPELGSYVGSFRLVVKKDGAVQKEESVALEPGRSTVVARAIEVDGMPGDLVEALAEALPPGGGEPVISRLATARITPGAPRLLRLRLDPRCASLPDPSGGPRLGVTCAAPLTCIAGTCQPNEVGEPDLEDFGPGWETAPPPDACRPARPGPPEVILGTGQTDYATLTDGQVLHLEQGPQGGHHIWMAVRMKNLRQSGSTTTVSGVVEGGPPNVPPLAVVFTFDRDEGSYCKVYGLRFQLDASALGPDGVPLPQPDKRLFLGKKVTVTAEVVDSTGARASSSRVVQLADELLCADGSERCNQ